MRRLLRSGTPRSPGNREKGEGLARCLLLQAVEDLDD